MRLFSLVRVPFLSEGKTVMSAGESRWPWMLLPSLASNHNIKHPGGREADTRFPEFSYIQSLTQTCPAKPCARLLEYQHSHHFDAANSASFLMTSRNSLRFLGLIRIMPVWPSFLYRCPHDSYKIGNVGPSLWIIKGWPLSPYGQIGILVPDIRREVSSHRIRL